MSFILFPTWIVVNDINFGSEKVIQWVHRRHRVLTHGQERLFCKVTYVSIHSFVEWFKHWTMWYRMFLWNKNVYGHNGFIYFQRRYKYLLLRRDISYFVKDHSDSTTMFINMLEFLIDNIFVFFGGRVFSTDSRHTYWYKLGSSFRRLAPLFVWGRFHTGASQEKRKETSLIL
jgi:hypothetical protein